VTKFKAGGETLGRHVGEVAKSEPSREEVSNSGRANTKPVHYNANDCGEAWWDAGAKPEPGHWSTKIYACGDKGSGLALMRGFKTGENKAGVVEVG